MLEITPTEGVVSSDRDNMWSNLSPVDFVGVIKDEKFEIYQIFSILAEACNEWRGACTTQLQRNITAMASRRRHCVRFDWLGNRTTNLLRQ